MIYFGVAGAARGKPQSTKVVGGREAAGDVERR